MYLRDARTVGVKEKLKKEPVALDVIDFILKGYSNILSRFIPKFAIRCEDL